MWDDNRFWQVKRQRLECFDIMVNNACKLSGGKHYKSLLIGRRKRLRDVGIKAVCD